MTDVKHQTLGASTRKVEQVTEEQKQKRAEMIDRYSFTPVRYHLDQLSVWALWSIAFVSLAVFCFVKAAALALS